MNPIRIGLVGYGNIGRGVERAVAAATDMTLAAVFTRREPGSVAIDTPAAPVLPVDEAAKWKTDIDVMILCGGSATDLPEQGPAFAADFSIVDSFDTHARIPEYLAAVGRAAVRTAAVVSVGWDPGLFSIMRTLGETILPDGGGQTFWGRGVSQGHSDAVRRVPGVKNAIQYTVPLDEAVALTRRDGGAALTARQKHRRDCFVVAEEGADREAIARAIQTMPHYFADYDTTVTFITDEELRRDHAAMPHGGTVIRTGRTAGAAHTMEFSIRLESNPEFTGSIMAAYARAAHRLAAEGNFGAKTVLDIPPAYLSDKLREDLIRDLV